MNESETRAEYIDPKLKMSGWGEVVDLFIGAINYDLKIATGIVGKGDKHKKQLVKFIKGNIGVKDFTKGFRNKKFNIFIDQDLKQRLPLKYKNNQN